MTSYLIRRMITAIITIIGATVLFFVIIQFIPGDTATILLGPRATPEIVASYRERMWLDQPVYLQIFRFLFNVFRGDLGIDVLNYVPVRHLVLQFLPYTMILAFSSILMACLLGIPLGVYAAAYKGSIMDKLTGLLSISMITTPHFLAGLFLLLIFSVHLNWLPSMGGGAKGDILDQIKHLILPSFSLSLGWIGYIARLMRASVLEELTEDYVRTARSKGLPERSILYKHVLRGSLIPVIAVLGVGFGNLLGGAVLIEIIFHRPGLGYLIYNSIQSRNYSVLQGGLIVAIFLYAMTNMLADLSHGFVDPRIRRD